MGEKPVEDSHELLVKVRDWFGEDVFSSNGKLTRSALGEKVFADREHARWLTALTFPEIYRRWKKAVTGSAHAVIVFDAALIFEWGIECEFDIIIVVTTPRAVVARRLRRDGRLTPQEIESRLAAQIPPEEKAVHATIHLKNDDTIEALEESVREIWRTCILPALKKKESDRE